MTVKAVVFDFDGLLMDTESTLLASWQYEWRQHGLELDVSTFFADHGGDVSEQRYAALARAAGPCFDREASRARRNAYRDRLHAGLGLSPGMDEWLSEGRELGLRLAVASSSPRSWVEGLLGGAGRLDVFELLACGDEVARPKPDPGVYELALRRLGLPADQAVAVEDSPHGVAAAKAAGMWCVAIPNAHTDRARFGTADVLLASAARSTLGTVVESLAGRGRRGGPGGAAGTPRPRDRAGQALAPASAAFQASTPPSRSDTSS